MRGGSGINVARICGGIIWMAGPAPLLDICPLGVFLRPFGKPDIVDYSYV